MQVLLSPLHMIKSGSKAVETQIEILTPSYLVFTLTHLTPKFKYYNCFQSVQNHDDWLIIKQSSLKAVCTSSSWECSGYIGSHVPGKTETLDSKHPGSWLQHMLSVWLGTRNFDHSELGFLILWSGNQHTYPTDFLEWIGRIWELSKVSGTI